MKIRIVADSSCDMLSVPGVDFVSAPLTVATEKRAFLDDGKLNIDEMLEYFLSYRGRSFTSCPSIETWLSCYEGADVIYVVTMSSNISGTYNAAKAAAGIYTETHPEARIHLFDTLSAGPEVRLLVEKLAEYVQAGRDFEEICRLGEDYMHHSRVFFALKSFHNFAQNGRVSKAVALIAGKLGIRILATASKTGTIETVDKCRGEQGTLNGFLDCLDTCGYQGGKIRIAQCKTPEFAEKIKSAILNLFPKAEILIYETGGLCSYYAERGGILLSCECAKEYV